MAARTPDETIDFLSETARDELDSLGPDERRRVRQYLTDEAETRDSIESRIEKRVAGDLETFERRDGYAVAVVDHRDDVGELLYRVRLEPHPDGSSRVKLQYLGPL